MLFIHPRYCFWSAYVCAQNFIVDNTVDSEIFVIIIFSRIALKDILVM